MVKTNKDLVLVASFLCVVALAVYLFGTNVQGVSEAITLDRNFIKQNLAKHIKRDRYPETVLLPDDRALKLKYTIDWELQKSIHKQFRRYRPDYAAFAAINAETGAVLSLVNYERHNDLKGNLSLSSRFPAASIVKIVSAGAMIDEGLAEPSTVIPFNGRPYTLYKRNVMSIRNNRWTRRMTLKQAFAKSINTVFGKIGVFFLKDQLLKEYAYKFGFNRQVFSDMPLEMAQLNLSKDDSWTWAETASGYTRTTLMSPLQGAMIAGSIINDGVMMTPYIVSEAHLAESDVYHARSQPFSVPLSVDSSGKMKELMAATVKIGTSRRAFRKFLRHRKYGNIEVGGKTGSLTGGDPRGKCDWYVGFGEYGKHKIAYAVLTVHKKYWTVKSSSLATVVLKEYFEDRFKSDAI